MCQLCEAEKKTHWYHEDNTCWIADCTQTGNPIIVLRQHTMRITSGDLIAMIAAAHHALEDIDYGITLLFNDLRNESHFHIHVLRHKKCWTSRPQDPIEEDRP